MNRLVSGQCMGIEDSFRDLGVKFMDDLGFSGVGFFWSADYRSRAEDMVDKYGPDVEVLIQYVWQGGSADLREMQSGYKDMYAYWNSRQDVFLPESAQEHTRKVKETMRSLALDESVAPYLKCPFMKVRMMNLARFPEKYMPVPDLENMLCYIAQGKPLSKFKMTKKLRDEQWEYLEKDGLL